MPDVTNDSQGNSATQHSLHSAAAATTSTPSSGSPAAPATLAASAAPTYPLRRGIDVSISHIVGVLALFIGVAGALFLATSRPSRGAAIFLLQAPARDLPAFHRIEAQDIMIVQYDALDIPVGADAPRPLIEGRYTLRSVAKATPLVDSDMGRTVPVTYTAGTVPVGLSVSAATIEGPRLRRGDLVDVLAISDDGEAAGAGGAAGVGKVTEFSGLLLLDMSPQAPSRTSQATSAMQAADTDERTYIVTLAVPLNKRAEFVHEMYGANVSITLTSTP